MKKIIVTKGAAVGPSITPEVLEEAQKQNPNKMIIPIEKFKAVSHAERLKKLARRTTAAVSQPQEKGRYRNLPCSCGSDKKTKKCCGKGA